MCKAILDSNMTSNGEKNPQPGDVSICYYCTNIGIFTQEMCLRKATGDELRGLMLDPEFIREYRVIRATSNNLRMVNVHLVREC